MAVGALVVGVGVIFPAAVPAMISMGQTMATNYLVGQATSMVTGLVKDAASAINPGLGTLLSGLETATALFNAGTSLLSGAGALGALDFGNLSSLLSFDTSNALSAMTGGLSAITGTFGVNIPGLAEANQALGYMGMAGQFGGHYNEAQWAMQEQQLWAKYGDMYAGPTGGSRFKESPNLTDWDTFSAKYGISAEDFIPIGGPVKALKPIVIGENMVERVIPFAKQVGADWYKPFSKNPDNWLSNNARWLRDRMKEGREVIDIGPDPARATRSSFYAKELEILEKANYPVKKP